MKEKIIRYYSDERKDDFASNQIEKKDLPENFRYIRRSPLYRIGAFIAYRLIATPFVFLYVKVKFHHRVRNRKVLKQAKGQGYFLYGNHTNGDLDAFVPSLLSFPKKAYIIADPDATSVPGLRTVVMMMGALPLPTGPALFGPFRKAIAERISEGSAVMIYPEAHIWPYYTDVRDFDPTSFMYAYMNNSPVFCFTNIYAKRRFSSRPKVTTYVDGPFMPDLTLNRKQNVAMLKEQVYGAMRKHIDGHPKYEYKYTYVRKPPEEQAGAAE